MVAREREGGETGKTLHYGSRLILTHFEGTISNFL